MLLPLTSSTYPLRRQQIVSDRLFDIALSGDQNELFELLEDDDSVNPLVSNHGTVTYMVLTL